MSDTENRPGIRIVGGGGGRAPFTYPEGIFFRHPQAQIDQTEAWVSRVRYAQYTFTDWLQGRPDGESKYKLLNWLTHVAQSQSRLVGEFFDANQRPVTPLQPGSWLRQRNVYGIQTCQVVSAINALRLLGKYNPQRHTEENIVALLGRPQADQFTTGAIERVLPDLAQNIRTRRSNSVAEIIEAAANGAAVMFPYSNDHEALIPPGFQLRRDARRGIEIQVANSLSTQAEFLPIERLIRSEIIMSRAPSELDENSVLIIERAQSPAIRTMGTARKPISIASGIRTVNPSGIRTARRPIQIVTDQ